MNRERIIQNGIPIFCIFVFLAGCSNIQSTQSISIARSPSTDQNVLDLEFTRPQPTSTTTPAVIVSEIPFCETETCINPWEFWLNRPITSEYNDNAAPGYRYGSSQHGTRDVHHGIEFINPQGTPVLAAASGRVVYAGNDTTILFGPLLNYYGNLIILQHSSPPGNLFFTLYGHLSSIEVSEGEMVESGQQIGEVGMTGSADGAHLHFEVRMGENSYDHTVNPELFLSPHQQPESGELNGVIAVQIQNAAGAYIPAALTVSNIDSVPSSSPKVYYPEPYGESALSTTYVGENYLVPDLSPGTYRLAFIYNSILFEREVLVEPNSLTLVEFHVE